MSRRVDALRMGLRGLSFPHNDLLVAVDEAVMVEDSESSEETLLAMEGRWEMERIGLLLIGMLVEVCWL